VGCGLGASTILMAKSYPKSEFIGFDYHGKSIETAKERAKDAGVGDRIRFEVARRNIPAKTMISSPSLIASTTWAIQPVLRRTSTVL
jgi:tRNA G46 methylase TrmB